MKQLLFLFSFLIIAILFAGQARATDTSGSTFQVTEVRHIQHQDAPYFMEEAFQLIGSFVPDGKYDHIVNSSSFQADITLVYGDCLLAIDYEANEIDYGKAIFTGWYEQEYGKFCELQGKTTAPNMPYRHDMFYLHDPYGFGPSMAQMKIVSLSSGQTLEYNTRYQDEDIRKYTFTLAGHVHPLHGLQVTFTAYPEVMRPALEEFLSLFLLADGSPIVKSKWPMTYLIKEIVYSDSRRLEEYNLDGEVIEDRKYADLVHSLSLQADITFVYGDKLLAIDYPHSPQDMFTLHEDYDVEWVGAKMMIFNMSSGTLLEHTISEADMLEAGAFFIKGYLAPSSDAPFIFDLDIRSLEPQTQDFFKELLPENPGVSKLPVYVPTKNY